MPLINITDKEGNDLPAREVGNVRFPTVYPEDVLQHIPELKLRDDDILITNWMRSAPTGYLKWYACFYDTATIRQEKRDNSLEYQPISVLDKLPSRRVFNTHLHFRYLPEYLKTKRCKVIYLLRNPRDAMVSWFRLHKARPHYAYKGTFYTWFPLCLNGELHWGSWFDHVRDWEKAFEDHPNLDVHFWFYEDMKMVHFYTIHTMLILFLSHLDQRFDGLTFGIGVPLLPFVNADASSLNPFLFEITASVKPKLGMHIRTHENTKNSLQELRKVSEFLGTDTKESLLEAVIDKCRIEKMKENKRSFDKLKAVDAHYGTGNIGDWKKMFTVGQYEEFEKMYRDRMTGSRFYTKYKGPVDLL